MDKFVTNRGKPGLLYDGFQHRIHREAKSLRTLWCTKKECNATCTTDLSDLTVLDGWFEHNHSEPDERLIQRHKVRQECKRKASDEPGERPNKIIMTEIAKQDTTDLLPGVVKSVRQGIYRRREKRNQDCQSREKKCTRR